MALKKHNNPNPSPATRFSKDRQPTVRGGGPRKQPARFSEFSKEYLSERIKYMFSLSKEELNKIRKNPKTTGLDALLSRCLYWGDMAEIEKMLARCIGIGPVPQRMEHSAPDGLPLAPPQITYQPIMVVQGNIEAPGSEKPSLTHEQT